MTLKLNLQARAGNSFAVGFLSGLSCSKVFGMAAFVDWSIIRIMTHLTQL